jgi:hypothetical protein
MAHTISETQIADTVVIFLMIAIGCGISGVLE